MELDEVVRAVPGVSAAEVTYHRERYGGGSLGGVVDVASLEVFDEVLAAVAPVLTSRVVVRLAARLPDGSPLVPGDLGLPQPPSGLDLRRRYVTT